MKAVKFVHAGSKQGLLPLETGIYCKDAFVTSESDLKRRWFKRLGDFLDNLSEELSETKTNGKFKPFQLRDRNTNSPK